MYKITIFHDSTLLLKCSRTAFSTSALLSTRSLNSRYPVFFSYFVTRSVKIYWKLDLMALICSSSLLYSGILLDITYVSLWAMYPISIYLGKFP